MAKKNKMKLKTKLFIFFIFFIIVAISLLFLSKKLLTSKTNENDYYTVRSETYENVIEIAGTVSAAQEQTLQALGDGTVLGVYVKKGDHVKKGDLILQLDAQEQEYNLAKLDYDMASTRISGSKKELELQEKHRLSLVQKINDRKVVATFDGIIADFDVSTGDSLEAKDKVGTIVNVDYLTAEVEIAETDVANLKIGQKVDFTFPACKETVEGHIVSWPAIGEITSRGATVVKAKIRIDNYPAEILPNYSFTGKIQITEPEDFLIVESLSIGRENREAFVVQKDSTEKIPVRVFPYGSGFVRIIEGNVTEGMILKAQSRPKVSGTMRNMPGAGGPNSKNAPKGGMNFGNPPRF